MTMNEIRTAALTKLVNEENKRIFECTVTHKDGSQSTPIFTLEEMQHNLKNAVSPDHHYFKTNAYHHITDCKEITLEYRAR